jgi:hypothetical protein
MPASIRNTAEVCIVYRQPRHETSMTDQRCEHRASQLHHPEASNSRQWFPFCHLHLLSFDTWHGSKPLSAMSVYRRMEYKYRFRPAQDEFLTTHSFSQSTVTHFTLVHFPTRSKRFTFFTTSLKLIRLWTPDLFVQFNYQQSSRCLTSSKPLPLSAPLLPPSALTVTLRPSASMVKPSLPTTPHSSTRPPPPR